MSYISKERRRSRASRACDDREDCKPHSAGLAEHEDNMATEDITAKVLQQIQADLTLIKAGQTRIEDMVRGLASIMAGIAGRSSLDGASSFFGNVTSNGGEDGFMTLAEFAKLHVKFVRNPQAVRRFIQRHEAELRDAGAVTRFGRYLYVREKRLVAWVEREQPMRHYMSLRRSKL